MNVRGLSARLRALRSRMVAEASTVAAHLKWAALAPSILAENPRQDFPFIQIVIH